MLLVTSISRAYATKNTCKFDKLRDLFIRNLRLLKNNLDRSALCRPDPEVVGDRYNTPLEYVSEWEVFRMLDNLQPTAAGLDGPPAWFLRVAAPIFYKTIAYLFNMSLATSTVPRQWKEAKIRLLYLKYQHQSNTLTTIQPLSHQLCPD